VGCLKLEYHDHFDLNSTTNLSIVSSCLTQKKNKKFFPKNQSFKLLESYRYGFQGQEIDDEVKGGNNSVNYKYRMHDPRVGRFFAIDPLEEEYPYYSPYQFSGNRVIDAIELEGAEPLLAAKFLINYTVEATTDNEAVFRGVDQAVYDGVMGTVADVVRFKADKEYSEEVVDGAVDAVLLLGDKSPQATLKKALIVYGIYEETQSWDQYDWTKTLTQLIVGIAGDELLTAATKVTYLKGIAKYADNLPDVKVKVNTAIDELNGGVRQGTQNVDDFVSPHAYSRHKYDATRTSSRSRTQYGEGVDVNDIKNQTIESPDKVVKNYDENGVHYSTTYKKTFNENISTSDTPTNQSRVIINHLNSSKSSQFPFYKPPKK